MRIYTNLYEAVREVERDLGEMGIDVQPQTMQDKYVGDNPDYMTKEVRGYGFKVVNSPITDEVIHKVIAYIIKCQYGAISKISAIYDYIQLEFKDRVDGTPLNPGNAWIARKDIWNEFMYDGKFAYTYSQRMCFQVHRILDELKTRPETRQGIINIHSNIATTGGICVPGDDMRAIGGQSRVPCSMYYQLMIRHNKVDLIYTMRSCDFLTHFPVDVSLAMMLQKWYAAQLQLGVGTFTYFTGSLHAYRKDMATRGIF